MNNEIINQDKLDKIYKEIKERTDNGDLTEKDLHTYATQILQTQGTSTSKHDGNYSTSDYNYKRHGRREYVISNLMGQDFKSVDEAFDYFIQNPDVRLKFCELYSNEIGNCANQSDIESIIQEYKKLKDIVMQSDINRFLRNRLLNHITQDINEMLSCNKIKKMIHTPTVWDPNLIDIVDFRKERDIEIFMFLVHQGLFKYKSVNNLLVFLEFERYRDKVTLSDKQQNIIELYLQGLNYLEIRRALKQEGLDVSYHLHQISSKIAKIALNLEAKCKYEFGGGI